MSKKVIIIGSGFGGMATAIELAAAGYEVTILEKNTWPGGRAQVYQEAGFRFDMGPSWYLLPDQFDRFFAKHGRKTSDYYISEKLSPSYKIFENEGVSYEIPNNPKDASEFFENIEAGAGKKFLKYLARAKEKYEFAINGFVYKQYDSFLDMVDWKIIKSLPKLDLFLTLEQVIYRDFKHPLLRKILGYPAVFLGGFPNRIPAVYSLLNWVDFGLGAWYPQGGFSAIAKGFEKLAKEYGVKFVYSSEVTEIVVENRVAAGVKVNSESFYAADFVVANADYHWVDQHLLDQKHRAYTEKKWAKSDLAASTLNFYLGLDFELKNVQPHTFFFDADWDTHGNSVYGSNGNLFLPSDRQTFWPEKPLFYAHVPSLSDAVVAPKGGTTLFILVPIAAGLPDTPPQREKYLNQTLDRMEAFLGQNIRDHIKVQKSYSICDYQQDYHAFKGNAFGLGQTLFQTASFRPKNYSKKVKNLFYTGQYTIPGTGTAMVMISGQICAAKIIKQDK